MADPVPAGARWRVPPDFQGKIKARFTLDLGPYEFKTKYDWYRID